MTSKTDRFDKLLKAALPFYEQGRPGDVEHIRWLYRTVPGLVSEEEADYDILMPLILLHDVGYARVPKGADPFKLDIRRLHMEKGAEIAEELLARLGYEKDKIAEVKRLIKKHDGWAFGDDFHDEPTLRVFNNFDFMWMASEKGFDIVRALKGMGREEFYRQVERFQEENEKAGRGWYNQRIAAYYRKLMGDREKDISV